MKKENRNVVPYQIYPPYQGINPMMPGVPVMNMMPYYSNGTTSCSKDSSSLEDLKEDIDNLKKRVNYLENILLNNSNYSNNYNSSNYQVM
jgi:hypothetical protein